jgi:hypothetical protein
MSEVPVPVVPATVTPEVVTDAKGRKYRIRKLNVLGQVKLLRAIGAEQARNEPYVQIVMMAAGVADIDGIPCPLITNEYQIDAAIARIDDDGFTALMVDMNRKIAALNAAAEAAADGGAPVPDPLALSA